jgi:hypothetical protein
MRFPHYGYVLPVVSVPESRIVRLITYGLSMAMIAEGVKIKFGVEEQILGC